MTLPAFFFQLLNQLRLAHWQTKSHAAHVALGTAYDAVDELADRLVETYMGSRTEVVKIDGEDVSPLNATDVDMDAFLSNCVGFLQKAEEQFGLESTDTDLLNIRDEIVGALNKLRYLLTLK